MPWATDAFEDACTRCDACIRACEEAILITGDGGFPTVDFARGGCTFCGACVDACEPGALSRAITPAWRLTVAVDEGCLSARGVTCRACGDVCDRRAIRFQLLVGGRAIPHVDTSTCNGCGNCVATCPVRAIHIQEAA